MGVTSTKYGTGTWVCCKQNIILFNYSVSKLFHLLSEPTYIYTVVYIFLFSTIYLIFAIYISYAYFNIISIYIYSNLLTCILTIKYQLIEPLFIDYNLYSRPCWVFISKCIFDLKCICIRNLTPCITT